MRFVSLLVTLLILAWVVLQQLGSGGSTNAAATNTAIQAENKAKAVESQVLQSAQRQAEALNHAETPAAADTNP